jgi:hypothetical protein
MIVFSVTIEVYQRIEDSVRKAAGAEVAAKPADTERATAKPASEQNMNLTTAIARTSSAPATASSTPTDSKPISAANPVAASSTGKSENVAAAPVNPWDTLRVGSYVIAKYP